MRLNYCYNFKNNIRFFINIENILSTINIDDRKISWTEPFIFRIRKDSNSYRTLKVPNIYNFLYALEYYKNKPAPLNLDMNNLMSLDQKKRMKISPKLGEFKVNSYSENQAKDYNQLIKYDYLIRMDIKSFYNNLYTHYIFKEYDSDYYTDKPLSYMNNGRTGGIIMGNYLSLYFAELFSSFISSELINELEEPIQNIDFDFTYFSDDFYFFCYEKDIEKVKKIFDKVLEKYNLEKNEDKIEIINYLEYTKQDVVEKYWKIMSKKINNNRFYIDNVNSRRREEGLEELRYNNISFTNQLIYRVIKINDYKKEKVFIVNFFKSKFFNMIDFTRDYFSEYNYHQICYIIKEYPEAILYMNNILDNFNIFQSTMFKENILNFYNSSLEKNYNDEQLYYFILLVKLNYLDKIKIREYQEKIIKTDNQLLISYYIMYNFFDDDIYTKLLNDKKECYWFVYYNILLYRPEIFDGVNNAIEEYLVPVKAKKNEEKKMAYYNFYKDNIDSGVKILNNIEEVGTEVNNYLRLKWIINKDNIDEETEKYYNLVDEEL